MNRLTFTKTMLFTFIVVSALLSGITKSYAVSVLDNSGFESGTLSPWYQDNDFTTGGEAWNVTDTDAHSGIYSATDVGNKEIRQDFSAVSTNDISEVSFWLKQPEIAISWVTLFYDDGSDYGDMVFLSSPDWEYFNITSWLTPGKNLTAFSLYGYEGGGVAEDRSYLDDVTINANVVPEPGTLLFLGSGLLGMVGFRKKNKN